MAEPNEPPEKSFDVEEVIVRAAEIAAEEGHPHEITGDNVEQAFEEVAK